VVPSLEYSKSTLPVAPALTVAVMVSGLPNTSDDEGVVAIAVRVGISW
jgi:hypothetical protein